METINLIIHGFAGSTDEIVYLEQSLRERGLNTRTVTLAGHGNGKKVLRKSTYIDWISSVEEVVVELTKTYTHVNLIGFSMGGLISAYFSTLPGINKIVFINTPVYLWNFKVILYDIFHRDPEKIAYYKYSIFGVSIKSDIDFLKILKKCKPKFKDVQNDALIVQCKGDETSHYRSAAYIKETIGDNSELRYYDGGYHQVFKVAGLRDEVCGNIYEFLLKGETTC